MGGPRDGSDFQNLHRNKRSMTLNLKAPEGLAAFKRMVKKADVVVENFRPDVKKRLGIDYKTLAKINPRLVYASISGFGQDGPVCRPARLRPDRAGHGRADVDHRPAGAGAGARRHPGRRSLRRAVRRARHPRRAARARDIRQGPGDRDLAACRRRSSCSISRPRAIWSSGEVARQAGNNHPTTHPDRRVQDRATATSTSPRPAAKCGSGSAETIGAHGAAAEAGLSDRRGAIAEPRRAQRRDRNRSRGPQPAPNGSSASTRPACPAGRSIPSTRCSPTRRCGISASRRASPAKGQKARCVSSASRSRCRARRRISPRRRPELGEHTDAVLKEFGFSAREIAALHKAGAV